MIKVELPEDMLPGKLIHAIVVDGNILPAETLIYAFPAQWAAIVQAGRGASFGEDGRIIPAERFVLLRPQAVMRWPGRDESPAPRKWRPSRMRNRMAQPGSARLDANSGIFDQIRDRVF